LLAVRGDHGPDCWEALVRPGRRIHEGVIIYFGDGRLQAEVLARTPSGGRLLRLEAPDGDVNGAIETLGSMPLPPYIHQPLEDAERYQTVYASRPGSAAAPTAGLHFTPELLSQLQSQGVGLAFVTLHIGLDTFRPMGEGHQVEDHVMHSEEIELDEETAARINAANKAGGRIVAVGTTAVRTLESAAERLADARERQPASSADSTAIVAPYRGRTSLFLRPGSTFRAVDIMLTNFHLPRSTLIVLVSAFAGREAVLRAYEEAVARGYRFYSFGDAMLIV
jgi:S-adenosylmethionine:tRNA ribosyltransferase-isomerase